MYDEISTHAPLARCDANSTTDTIRPAGFQLTHLLRGATSAPPPPTPSSLPFQLTHLLRGATGLPRWLRTGRRDFNSRTSCEVRPGFPHRHRRPGHFNSRTSCEVRRCSPKSITCWPDFNSRTSCEVRRRLSARRHQPLDFNSRTSCEVRLCTSQFFQKRSHHFNSRTSCEVRLGFGIGGGEKINISTHAPLARCDSLHAAEEYPRPHFNSRTSCEVRRIMGLYPGFPG